MSEVSRLCTHAAHGAGLSWGMADEAADAVLWLASYGLPGPSLLARSLNLNDQVDACQLTAASLHGVWSAPSGRLCPLFAGAALSDCAFELKRSQGIEMTGITDPLLLVPFAGSAALTLQNAVGLEWQDVRIITDGASLSISGDEANVLTECVSNVTCRVQEMRKGDPPTETRVQIEADCWATLVAFAQRTYAPATESSRLLGAGTGPADND